MKCSSVFIATLLLLSTGSPALAQNPGRFLSGAPGGQMLAFNTNGSNIIELAPSDGFSCAPDRPSEASLPSVAQNGTIVFSSQRDGIGDRVFVMNGDGSNVRQITFADATGAGDLYPAISPDGTKVAFVSKRAVVNKVQFQKIFVANIDGTGLRQVEPVWFDSSGNSNDSDENFAWSPDSKKLAFRGYRQSTICNPSAGPSGVDVVGAVNLDGSGETLLACDSAAHGSYSLDWSPDGNLIAYSRSSDAGGPVIVAIIDPRGNSKYGLTSDQLGSEVCGQRSIHFSPDSTRLAYQNSVGCVGSRCKFNGVSIINLDGTGRTDSANVQFAADNFWWAPGEAIPKPTQLTLAPDPVQVWPGHTQQLTPSLLDGSGNVITRAVQGYCKMPPNCESIDATGLVSYVNTNTGTLNVINSGQISNTVTVNCLAQAPSGCTYSITPTSQSLPGAGGTNSVSVIAQNGCTWSAASNTSWITISSGASGAGSGTVSYAAAANSGPARSGVITIAGQAFTVNEAAALFSIQNVSAASYLGRSLTAESIASAFGSGLATATQGATSTPLPTSLAGTQVAVKDSAGTERPAPLFYVSPTQINYEIPPQTATGPATVTATSGDGAVSRGTVQIAPVAPGLFSANGNGSGVAAAVAVRGAADGTQTPVAVLQCPAAGGCVSVPMDLGAATDQVVIELYGTGIRGRTSLNNVTCTVGAIPAQVLYAGAQGAFVGLDQVNVVLPRALAGRGEVNVILAVDGQSANTVTLNVK